MYSRFSRVLPLFFRILPVADLPAQAAPPAEAAIAACSDADQWQAAMTLLAQLEDFSCQVGRKNIHRLGMMRFSHQALGFDH